jgi:hypothetical protein
MSMDHHYDDSEVFGEPIPLAECRLCERPFYPKESTAKDYARFCSPACEVEFQVPRCPRCGSVETRYDGDREVCGECGK